MFGAFQLFVVTKILLFAFNDSRPTHKIICCIYLFLLYFALKLHF